MESKVMYYEKDRPEQRKWGGKERKETWEEKERDQKRQKEKERI